MSYLDKVSEWWNKAVDWVDSHPKSALTVAISVCVILVVTAV